MNPYLEIREKYENMAGEDLLTWEELVGFHLANENCYLLKGPEYFVMGRPVNSHAGEVLIRDLTHNFSAEEIDCWFLYAFAGDMRKALQVLPYDLPLLAWERAGDPEKELKFFSLSSIRRLSPP